MGDTSNCDKDQIMRVKVYVLNDENGLWDDNGIGYVDIDKPEVDPAIMVRSEENNNIIMYSRISAEYIYLKQEDTLIVWNEINDILEEDVDLALRFKHPEGCDKFWNRIKQIQKALGKEEDFDMEQKSEDESSYSEDSINLLPPVNIDNIDSIKNLLQDENPIVYSKIRNEYISELCELFRVLEEKQDIEKLESMCEIFKSLFMSEDYLILLNMTNDKCIMDVIGALEYDVTVVPNVKHREYITKKAVFKLVVPLQDEIISLIQYIYRLKYLRDVVIARYADDITTNTISAIINMYEQDIVREIISDQNTLNEISKKLNENLTPDQSRNLLGFIQELLHQSAGIEQIYELMENIGLYDALHKFIESEDPKTRTLSLELIKLISESDPSSLRAYILSNPKFLGSIVKLFVNDKDTTTHNESSEIITNILNLHSQDEDKHVKNIVDTFYNDFALELFKPLTEGELKDIKPGNPQSHLLYKLLQLAKALLQAHSYKMRPFFNRHNILGNSKWMFKSKDRQLTLEFLDLIRTCIGTKQKDLINLIIEQDLFKSIIDLYLKNRKLHNLIDSAILELFYFIKELNITSLIKFIITNYYSVLFDIKDVNIFQSLKDMYDEILEKEKMNEIAYLNMMKENEKFEEALAEERFFEASDDEEEIERESHKRQRDEDIEEGQTPTKKKKF